MFTLASKKNEIGTKISKCFFELMFLLHILADVSIRRRFPDPMAAFRPPASPQEKVGTLRLPVATRAVTHAK